VFYVYLFIRESSLNVHTKYIPMSVKKIHQNFQKFSNEFLFYDNLNLYNMLVISRFKITYYHGC